VLYAREVFEHVRPVRWSDVDAAGIVYFPRFLEYCHDAIEALFAALAGGYAALTMDRGIGVPTVHFEGDFHAPLRYGDVCVVQLRVVRIGRTSVTFRHTLVRQRDGIPCADFTHVVAVSDLRAMRAIELPDDVRAVVEAHAERT
jgi:4-hydroxybenzoyl-CoA thioesterase